MINQRKSAWRRRALSPQERARIAGLLVAAAGVAAGFVVMIGTGYRVTHTPGSPIGDVAYVASIVVLVVVLVAGVHRVFRHGTPWGATAMNWHERQRFTEERRRDEEGRRRRLAVLAADPVRRRYVERIERGASWSDAQIEYDLNTGQVATCEHLQPMEREMRAAGIEVRLKLASRVGARCRVDVDALRARFPLPAFVEYAEPAPQGRAFEDPLPAHIACAQCTSVIDVVHRVDATPETPLFPLAAAPRNADAPPPSEIPTDRFTQLRSRVLSLARRIEAPAHAIPTYHWSAGNGLPHIEIEGDTYHYVVAERGQEFERFSTASEEAVLYRIFRDIAFTMATHPARPLRKPGEDFRRELFRQQLVLLGRLNAEWATRCAAEHEEVLARHPFVD